MRQYTDQSTGEIVAVVSLATWERLVRLAELVDPCPPGVCGSEVCSLSHALLLEDARRDTFGPLVPRDDA